MAVDHFTPPEGREDDYIKIEARDGVRYLLKPNEPSPQSVDRSGMAHEYAQYIQRQAMQGSPDSTLRRGVSNRPGNLNRHSYSSFYGYRFGWTPIIGLT